VSPEQIAQLAAAGIVNGSFSALLGVAFGLILGVTGRFHYAFAFVFTAAAYVASVLQSGAGAPPLVAVIAALIVAACLGMAIERWIYRPLARAAGALSLLTIFISSLGVTIAGVNVITLVWTAFSRTLPLFEVKPLALGSVTITNLEVVIIVVALVEIAALDLLLSRTDFGRSVKAVRGNIGLARIVGLAPDRIYLAVFAISSVLCGAAGILNGARFAVVPDMGDRPVVFAFVVAFLGGTRSRPIRIGLAGLFIGLVESLSGLFVSPQWTALVVFTVLFIYLVLHPVELASLRRRLLPSRES
jgi:branched-subunit amino acid ABC-type transport system permease component